MELPDWRHFVGPAVVCVRGPSRSGKTTLSSALIAELGRRGRSVAYTKRTHHLLDLPEKSSSRIWLAGPEAMALRASDRIQLTLPPGDGTVAGLLAQLPGDIDVVILETHQPEPFPTLLSTAYAPSPDEDVLARWSLESIEEDVSNLATRVEAQIPADRSLDFALRAAVATHGGHLCPGLVLGTRIALAGAGAVGVPVPDLAKRLTVLVETDRCAADAVAAVTGCRVGRRTLRLLDYGKMAATFIDASVGSSVRVAARPGLRESVHVAQGRDRHQAQTAAYLAMPGEQLMVIRSVTTSLDEFDLPGPPRRRITCGECGEEVSDGRERITEDGSFCRPCAAARVYRIPVGAL